MSKFYKEEPQTVPDYFEPPAPTEGFDMLLYRDREAPGNGPVREIPPVRAASV
jgi:hypothetical protein